MHQYIIFENLYTSIKDMSVSHILTVLSKCSSEDKYAQSGIRPNDCKRSSLAVAIGEQETEAPPLSLKHDINVLGQGDFSHEKLAESQSANLSKLSNLGMDPVKFDQYLSGGTHSKPESLLQLDQVVQIVEYLTHKLKTISAFREVAPSAAQSFNGKEKQLREKFIRTCENHDAFLVSKSNASKLDVDAGHAVKEAMERVPNFSKEILAMKEAIEFVSLGQEMPAEIVAGKDVRELCKASLEGSAKSLQVTKKELDTDLTGYTEVCVCQLLAIIRSLKKEIDNVEAVELNHFLEVQWEMGKEGSSLQSLLDSLELKLDAFMRRQVELGGTELESAKIPICKCNIEDFLPENARAGVLQDRSTGPECKMEQEMTEADIMRSDTCGIVLDVIENKPRETIDDAELGLLRTIDEVGTSSKGTATSCGSTCGVEYLSSGEGRGSVKSSVQGSAVSISHIEVDAIYSSIPEFSIRDYVFGARHSNINMNWPFSRRSLQHCLTNGVKNLLPPFQTFDSLRNESTGPFLANSTLAVTKSNMDEKPYYLDNQPILCMFNRESDYEPETHFSDSNTFLSRDQDIGPKTSTHSQSEIESVSTCDIPIDKESNRFESSASVPLCKSKGSCTLPLKKKRKLAVKSCSNIGSDTAEDVTSASAVTNEAVALKTCPVCANFSSSSNTKLNAHIDQCLSAGSPDCMDNNTKCVKPRIKPRKFKLISDIYSTASCCTLEELDRRNGRIPTADSDIGPPLSKVNKGMDQRGLLGHLKESSGDTAVYIDSRGRKVRILSQSVDPSSESKVVEELKPKMMLKRRKRSNLYCSNKKRHFAKGLKYSHFSNQTKKFSSHRPYITKGRAGDKAPRTVKGKKLPLKLREHNTVTDSETVKKRWYSVRTIFSKNRLSKGKRGRPKCKLRSTEELLADNHQSCSHSNSFGNHGENPSSGSAKAHVTSMQSSTKSDTSPEVVVDQNKGLSNLKNNIASRTLLKGALNSSCESNLASSKLNTIMDGLPEPSDLTEICSSSSGKDTETRLDVAEHSGKSSDANQATRLSISEKTVPSASQSSFAAFPGIPSSNGSAIEIPNGTNLDKVVACCNEIDQDSDLMQADLEHLCHTREKTIAGCLLNKLGRKEGVGGLTESFNPNMHKFAEISDTQSNIMGRSKLFFQSEVFAHLNQPCLGDMQSMFYAFEVGVGKMDHENEDAEPENCISQLLVDSIPIPGPPGSYLPSFRESCIEDLQGNNSSLTTNWVMSSQETPAMVDHFSDSPVSAASSYLSAITTSERIISKPDASKAHPPLLPLSICSRSVNEAAEPRMESVFKASDAACVGTEQAALDLENSKEMGSLEQRESPRYDNDQHQCYFSMKEREHWDAPLGLKESQLVGRKAVDAVEEPASDWHVAPWSSGLDDSAETGTGMSSHKLYRTLESDCPTCSTAKSVTLGGDSGVTNQSFVPPTPPVLRLMGKNLMVINKDEDVTRRPPQTAHESQRIKCSSFSVVPRGTYGSPCDLDSDVAPHPIIVPLQQHLNFRSPDTSVLGVPVEEHLKLRSWNSFHSSMNLGTPSSHKNITSVEAHGTNLYR